MTVLFFSQPGCRPCAALKPRVIEAARRAGADLAVYDCTKQPIIAAQYHVMSVPTVLATTPDGVTMQVYPHGRWHGLPTAEQLADYLEAL